MRLLIYLLAMLTGFTAAEAARPVAAVPASVGAEVGSVYAEVAVGAAEQIQDRPSGDLPVPSLPIVAKPVMAAYLAESPTTPIMRHDVILG